MIACGLDFGTSNSAIGVAHGKTAALVPVEASSTLMASAVFFAYEAKGRVLYGNEAIAAHVDQTEGRLMRALKSILGSPLIDEETSLGNRKVPLTNVVEIFVRHLKQKAEAFAGQEITAVVHGRPVHFVDDDERADARAQEVLETVARRVGFRDVAFVYEPIAAAYHYEQTIQGEELVLIADIGGGTSDFSVIRVGPQHRDRADRSQDVLATAGARVGGTDFDTALSLASAMPLLGLGTRLIEKNLPMPSALYHELAAWPTINFAYTHKAERELAELVSLACEPEKVERLLTVVRRRLGHRLASAVEDAKIALSAEESGAVPSPFSRRVSQPRRRVTISTAPSRPRWTGCTQRRGTTLRRRASVLPPSRRSFSPAGRAACRPCAPPLHGRLRRPVLPAAQISCPWRWD